MRFRPLEEKNTFVVVLSGLFVKPRPPQPPGLALALEKLNPCYDVCVVADPDLLWGQILKMLYANVPEEFYAWLSNLQRTVAPLLERALDLLQAAN